MYISTNIHQSNENNLSYYLDEINIILEHLCFIYLKKHQALHNHIFNKIIDIVNNNSNMEVSVIKIKLLVESMLYLHENHKEEKFKKFLLILVIIS